MTSTKQFTCIASLALFLVFSSRGDCFLSSNTAVQPPNNSLGKSRQKRVLFAVNKDDKNKGYQEREKKNPEPSASESQENSQELGSDPDTPEPIRTIGGGADMIFEMARQMLLWEGTEESFPVDNASNNNNPPPAGELLKKYQQDNQEGEAPVKRKKRIPVLPRWRPLEGVSDVNPKFRTQAPVMNSVGYSKTIWRNARKANKPSLWRHALRTYDRMDQNTATSANGQRIDTSTTTLKVQRTNSHHEGALVACAKLGLWRKALQIYQDVEAQEEKQTGYRKIFITDNMVLSLIRACVRGSRDPENADKSFEERRAPLDVCSEILLSMEEKHGLPLVARHLNPLAAAYQKMGLISEASTLLSMNLEDRTSGPEAENGQDPFNVNDVRAKDKGSYSLLVKGAVSEGNWADAVDALRTMTDAGLYPNSRNLNGWTEVSERKTKQRATRSWKKKRDEYWLESVR